VQQKAWTLARFYDFLIARYQGDIHAVTGHVLVQPIDEFNRPAKADYGGMQRIPPSGPEVEELFAQWRDWLPTARRYLPAAPGLPGGVVVAPGRLAAQRVEDARHP
jgi:hypothetical protein